MRIRFLLLFLVLLLPVCTSAQQSTVLGRTPLDGYGGSPYCHIAHAARTDLDTETFAQAVTRIGSTPCALLIEKDLNVDAAVTIPTTLKLVWTGGARLVKATGGSLTFQGDPFVYSQEMGREPLFAGFGINDIDFTGDTPTMISSEIAYYATNSCTQRLYLLTNWFEGRKVTFSVFPRPITNTDAPQTDLEMKDYHSLYWRNGAFTNTNSSGAVFAGVPNISMGSYSKFYSESPATRIQTSSVFHANALLMTKVDCIDCVIEGNYFDDGGGTFDSASPNIQIGPGGFNCHIRNNVANGLEGYQFEISSGNGHVPSYCSIDGNRSTGYITQNIALIGGTHCKIVNNTIDVKGYTHGSAFATLMDIEPNQVTDVIEDLLIEGNTWDFRDATLEGGGTQFADALLVQGIFTPGAKRVTIRNNRFLANPDGHLEAGIGITGATGLTISGNEFTGAAANIALDQCNHFRLFDNTEYTTVAGQYDITASGNGFIYSNIFASSAVIAQEAERTHPGQSNGTSTLTLAHSIASASDGRVFDSYAGQTVTYQDADWPITATNTSTNYESFTVTGTLPNVGPKSFVNTAINTSTGNITITAHGFTTADRVQWESNFGTTPTGLTDGGTYYVRSVDANTITLHPTAADASANTNKVIPSTQGNGTFQIVQIFLNAEVNTGTDTITLTDHRLADKSAVQYFGDSPLPGLTNNQIYYIIRVDANNVKLADTRAHAVSGTAVDITGTAGTFHELLPIIQTKFSNNKYRNNNFGTYNLLGTSANNGSF